MAAYASVNDIEERLTRTLSEQEKTVCALLLVDAATIIDAVAFTAPEAAKKTVSCRMVLRSLGDGTSTGIPMGATQGSMSALGYTQSWTMSGGGSGELYLSKTDRQLLGVGNRIGSYSPIQADGCGENLL